MNIQEKLKVALNLQDLCMARLYMLMYSNFDKVIISTY